MHLIILFQKKKKKNSNKAKGKKTAGKLKKKHRTVDWLEANLWTDKLFRNVTLQQQKKGLCNF